MSRVTLKAGNSVEGLKAAASHTGKMASPYEVYRDLLDEAGAVQVHSLTSLLEAAEVLSLLPTPPARGELGGVSVFSIPGGTRAMTADSLEEHQVPLATFDRATVARLADALPEFGGTENPTDLTGQVLSHPGLFDKCLRIIAQDPHTEALIVQVANRGPRDVMERCELLASVAAHSAVPIVVSFLGDALPAADKARLREAGVVCARDPAEASRFLGWLYRARTMQSRLAFSPPTDLPAALTPLTWDETARFLQECGVGLPGWKVVGAQDDAALVCANLQYPVAVKAMPEDADHKTELGLVTLNVAQSDIAAQVDRIRSRAGKPQAAVLVQEMNKGGIEVLLSALRNPDFGPILAIGMGGTATELHHDLAYVSLPTHPDRVRRALSRLKLAKLLAGFRGAPAAEVEGLLDAATAIGARFVTATPAMSELEINPLFVHERASRKLTAVDALVKLA